MHTDYLMYMGPETILLGLLSLELLHEMERQVSGGAILGPSSSGL